VPASEPATNCIYLCPAGEKLTHHAIYNDKKGMRRHIYKQPRSACRTCALREQCASKKPAAGWRRSITRIEESSITFNSTKPFTVRNLDSCFHSHDCSIGSKCVSITVSLQPGSAGR
jgi:hypothetical protein